MFEISSGQEYDLGVQMIVANCGDKARKLIADNPEQFTDKKDRQLAGTSPE